MVSGLAYKTTVVARWETSQMEPELEWRMWRQLRGAFEIDRFIFVPRLPKMEGYTFQQFDTMDEALASLPLTTRCFLEPNGQNYVSELPHDDITLIIGNTEHSNIEYADPSETYYICSPGSADLYGINAAAIALACEHGQ